MSHDCYANAQAAHYDDMLRTKRALMASYCLCVPPAKALYAVALFAGIRMCGAGDDTTVRRSLAWLDGRA